jgi:hypothetical protein
MIDLFLLSFVQYSFLVIFSYKCCFTSRILNSVFPVVAKLCQPTFNFIWWEYDVCKMQYTQTVRYGKFSTERRIYYQELVDMKRKNRKAFMKAAVMLLHNWFYHSFSNWQNLF